MEQIIYNACLRDMQQLPFGYPKYLMGKRTCKLKYRNHMLAKILNYLPSAEKAKIKLAAGKNGQSFIGIIENSNDSIWYWLDSAIKFAKADEFRKMADRIELGQPAYLTGKELVNLSRGEQFEF